MNDRPLDAEDDQEVDEREPLRPDLVYEVVRRGGLSELERSFRSLAWSGFAAGLAISFSTVGEAMIASRLPEAGWAELVADLGYTLGFLIVIMGRLQLFTEHTVTAVLPVTYEPSFKNFGRLARLWGIVLVANMAGAVVAAWFFVSSGALPADGVEAMLHLGRHLTEEPSFLATVAKGVGAGFLIAALVWMLPTADTAQVAVILLVTWLIAIAEFAHVVAGTVEIAALVISGANELDRVLIDFWLPALIGNLIGGAGLFALLAYGQVHDEV